MEAALLPLLQARQGVGVRVALTGPAERSTPLVSKILKKEWAY